MTPSDRTPLTDTQFDDVLLALAEDDLLDDDTLAAARRRVLAAAGNSAGSSLSTAPEPVDGPIPLRPRRRHRVAVALVAAAVLALVGVLAAVVVQAVRPGSTPAAGGGGVVCLVDPGATSADADARAAALVKARLAALTSTTPTITSAPGRIEFSASGVDQDSLLNVCSSPQPSLRPLVSAAVPLDPHRTTDGSSTPAVELPTSEAAYAALSAADRARVQQAVAATDCTASLDASPDRSIVACDSATAPTAAYLLGPAIVGPDQIAGAIADAPTAETAAQGWTVMITPDTAGARAVGAYTSAHTGDGSNAAEPTACGPTTTPCADYLGIVTSGVVVSVPVISSAITGSIQISGALTQTSANVIAAVLRAGALTLVPA